MSGRHIAVPVDRRPGPDPSTPRSSSHRLGRAVAMAFASLAHAALGVTVAVSGLIMPNGAVTLLGLFWVGGVAAMILGRSRPALLIAVPVTSWVVWFVVAWIGDAWFGWTA